ncbi:MAG: hypothetical protein EZS28_008007 [Streblomastix strix]|uniref:Uncharacterized protein n=1 Tax=Streblomastix strix TaxID=222440 RepID=A0A5J4WPB7_9EUKA|nr:MAG: hypothetical protein EZS28_008007 [Streblomastix strix]
MKVLLNREEQFFASKDYEVNGDEKVEEGLFGDQEEFDCCMGANLRLVLRRIGYYYEDVKTGDQQRDEEEEEDEDDQEGVKYEDKERQMDGDPNRGSS